MEFRQLGRSGLRVPVLAFGTATFGGGSDFYRAWGSTDAAEAKRLVDLCLDAGVSFFDTANSYSTGMAEEILGAAIAVATGGHPRDQSNVPHGPGSERGRLITPFPRRACEDSLRRLRTDHIDVYYMHGFDENTPVEETLQALDALVRAERSRYVACSNFSGWHLMKSLAVSDRYGWPRYVAHQAYYSLVAREFEWELMPLAIDQGVGTVVWSPLSGGARPARFVAASRFRRSHAWASSGSSVLVTSSVSSTSSRCSRTLRKRRARRFPRWPSTGCFTGRRSRAW